MKKFSTKMLVEAGVMVALAQVLSYIKIFEAPFGGSVTAGSMIPILLFAIRWGVNPGVIVGVVYGVLQFILGAKYTLHPLSIVLDYLVAFGCLGFAGLSRKNYLGVMSGIVVGVLGRFFSHLISGAIVFAEYAPEGMNPWVYSAGYNAGYLGIELVIVIVLVSLLFKPLKKYILE